MTTQTTMKDVVGNKIEIGSRIAAIVSHGRNAGGSFSFGVVTKTTDKTVFFEGKDYTGTFERNRKVSPSKVVVVDRDAYARGRRDGLEEAAKYSESLSWASSPSAVANQIRALKQSNDGG